MDKSSRREWARHWLEVGIQEGATFKSIAARAGINERTLRNWSKRFRAERAARGKPDRDPNAFVKLAELADEDAPRLEIVFPDDRRLVFDGPALIEHIARLLTSEPPC